MNLKSHLSGLTGDAGNLTLIQQAEFSCRLASEFEKHGDYESAKDALRVFWPDSAGSLQLEGLDDVTKAGLLLRAGTLASWCGATEQSEGDQETAKNLITQSVEIFRKSGEAAKLAEAYAELALCYWREGAYDEARIHLAEGLSHLRDLDPDLKAVLLIRAGIVEVWAQRLNEALRFYNEALPLVERSQDHALKGSFHIEYGLVFRRLATPENAEDYLDRALIEYAAASFHFEQAGNTRAVARVENNLGYLYFTIRRYKEAHVHLDRARQLFQRLRDVGAVAQVDETRARTLLAQGYIVEAERIVRAAARVLERGGQQAVLAEALTTHAVALARLGNDLRARALFERAVSVAETAGDLEGAGRAKLTIIEELGRKISAPDLVAIYRSAIELLRNSQDPASAKRLISCAERLFDTLTRLEAEAEESTVGSGSWEGFSLKRHVKAAESAIIERALREAGGSVSKAAKLLGFKHHQSLISLLNGRHKDLLKTRSVVRRRRRHILRPRVGRRPAPRRKLQASSEISILYVEDDEAVTRSVAEALTDEHWQVDFCADRDTALLKLTGDDPYDVLVFDNDVSGTTGLELLERARKITHRRRTPIVVVANDDSEKAAWRAGANAFLRSTDIPDQLASTIRRLIKDSKAAADTRR
jgi:tetratricopeptide (TPR) repeat protein/ActR/RegA family two-component response regulator